MGRHNAFADLPLFWKPDGRFPNHEANPLKAENLVDLQKAVIEKKCDIGIMHAPEVVVAEKPAPATKPAPAGKQPSRPRRNAPLEK